MTTQMLMATVAAFAEPTQQSGEPNKSSQQPLKPACSAGRPSRKRSRPRQRRTAHRARRENTNDDSDEPDQLVPDPIVWEEFGISAMTGWRWTQDPKLGFPRPIKIRNRCFRSRHALEEFKERMMRESIGRRACTPSEVA